MKVRTPIRPMRVVEDSNRRYIPHLIAIALLWALAMTLDYHDQVAAERERAIAEYNRAESWKAQMAECLNGTWRGITPSGTQIGCMPAQEFQPQPRRKGI